MNNLQRMKRNCRIFYLHAVEGLTYNQIQALDRAFRLSHSTFCRIIKRNARFPAIFTTILSTQR